MGSIVKRFGTAQWVRAHQTRRQTDVYPDRYRRHGRLRWLFRFDVRNRCRRLQEVAQELGLDMEEKSVLDVGFGGGHLLATFPRSCRLYGAEISRSAVEGARQHKRFAAWCSAEFIRVREDEVEDLPAGPFDVVISSHTIEHVPDDRELLAAIHRRLIPGGTLCLYVPVEEPYYNPDHVRNYSLDTITRLVQEGGFEILFREGSMHINGHVWKIITIPSRRRWPVLKPLVDAFRLVTLSMFSYRAHRVIDSCLDRLRFGQRQALLIARKPLPDDPVPEADAARRSSSLARQACGERSIARG